MRRLLRLSVLATLGSGAVAAAQGPGLPPGPGGRVGYANFLPYDAVPPAVATPPGAMIQPTAAVAPPGMPVMAPVAPAKATAPVRESAALIDRGPLRPSRQAPAAPTGQHKEVNVPPTPVEDDGPVEPACAQELAVPSVPVVSYVAPSAPAWERNDCSYCWLRIEYLNWWMRGSPLRTPLVTTGPAADGTPGVLSSPGTQVLAGGGERVNRNPFPGGRFYLGCWCDEDRLWSVEGGAFALEQDEERRTFTSDAAGTPVLARPFVDPAGEAVYLISFPDTFRGSATVAVASQLYGAELNVGCNTFRHGHWTGDLLAGGRFLTLRETLTVGQLTTSLADDVLLFAGSEPLPAGSSVLVSDLFRTTNRFYGGQLGGRLEWVGGCFTVGLMGKVALGVNDQTVRVAGESALFAPGTDPGTGAAVATAPGGVLAVPSNSGRFTQARFAVVPEAALNVGVQLTHWLKLQAGYSGLYWTNVLRPGDQVSRRIDGTQVPIDPGFTGDGTATQPRVPRTRSDFWAHGFNVGFEVRY